MKEKRNLLISLILGTTIGWALGFLRLPFLEKQHSFWVGFICCFAVIALLVLMLFIWNKNRLLNRLIGKESQNADTGILKKTYFSISTVVAFVVLLVGLICGLCFYKQNKSLNAQSQSLKKQVQEQALSLKTMKKNSFTLSMSVFMGKIEEELKSSPSRRLSEASIARIATLSHSFEPSNYFGKDSLLVRSLSFERGQLLLGLSHLEMDSSSFNKIKQSATFLGADLKEADLSNLDLTGIDLRKAHFWGANLQNINLKNANLNAADLSWTDLTAANLQLANLNGADLSNSKLIRANLQTAKLQYTKMNGVLLNQADLTKADLLGSSLLQANWTQTNLTETNLVNVHVRKDWVDTMDKWQIIGTEKIKTSYYTKIDRSRHLKQPIFRLQKK